MNHIAVLEPRAQQQAAGRVQLPLAPSLEPRRLQIYLLLLMKDAIAIMAAFVFTSYIYMGLAFEETMMLQAQALIPIYWTAALTMRVYSLPSLARLTFAQRQAALALGLSELALMFIGFMTKSTDTFSRFGSVLAVLLAIALLIWLRALTRPAIRARCGDTGENTLVIDDGGDALRVVCAFHIDARQHHLRPDLADPHMLDRIGLYMMNMDRVLVTCPPERRATWALVLKSANVQGEIVDREVRDLGALGARRGHGYGALVVSGGPLGMRARVLKRAFDLSLASLAVALLAPLLVLVSVLIKIEDGGPILFVQQRTGRGNRFFPIYKFRSMRAERLDHSGSRSASKDDDRITRIGRLIRRTSIDELPQLFNVILGHMSIVGPRPHAIGSLAGDKLFWEVDQRYWLRHSLKPGLTGLAQVRGLRGATACESDLTDRLQADLEYLDNWTILRDVRIVFATLGVLMHDKAF